jgi:ribonuclease H / adenosylcobalamin/alpha-ribazole phosphatase
MSTQWSQPAESVVRLILVRHAAHLDLGRRLTGRAPGVSLSEAGRRQADALGRSLASEGLAEVQTSPRERARETAAAIAEATGAAVAIAAPLDEIDFGEWTGARFADLDGTPAWDEWNARRATARAPGGESMAEATSRIADHVARIAVERAGACLALVTHSDMIRGLVAHALGLSLDNLLRFEIGPGSLTRVEAAGWGARVISLNEQPCEPVSP